MKLLIHYQLNHLISESYFYNYAEIIPNTLAKYCLSYLTSLDIESLYLKDAQLAFYVFENIRYHSSSFPFNNKYITFLEDKYSNLQDKIFKLNRLKK